jgi:hypothetical protein
MILTPDIFEGEITIGQLDNVDVAARLQWFVEKYEPLYLRRLLGRELAGMLSSEIENETHDAKWDDLANELKSMLANYVYYYYQTDNETTSAGVGEVETEAENAVKTTVIYKTVKAWNDMVKQNLDFRMWIDRTVYPEYKPCISELFHFKNTFGL